EREPHAVRRRRAPVGVEDELLRTERHGARAYSNGPRGQNRSRRECEGSSAFGDVVSFDGQGSRSPPRANGTVICESTSDVASPAGFEPATYGLGNRCSILLSYG